MAISGTRTPKAMPLILVVDDDLDGRNIVLEVLGWDGYRTCEANDGETAIAVAQAELPDAVILDVRLPGAMDGFEVFSRLRADPRTRSIPVMFLTAYAYLQLRQREKAMALGADGFLTKPFSTDELRAELDATLRAGRKAARGT
jgi:CheY-like chemotaxis protein